MRKYFEQLIASLKRKGEVIRTKKIVYQGGIPSLNDLYGTKHWTSRHRDAVKYHELFTWLLRSALGTPKEKSGKFSVFIFFNSRHDTDNIIGIEKYFTDMLVKMGYVEDDNKKFFRALVIVPDERLKKNTVEFIFATHNVNN